jgi:cephalosporin hydroxylase
MSSLDVKTDVETDFLLVDSVHKYNHVIKELKIYASLTKKYIMLHDTTGIPQVYNAVIDFLKNNDIWKEIEVFKKSAGYVILERTKNEE